MLTIVGWGAIINNSYSVHPCGEFMEVSVELEPKPDLICLPRVRFEPICEIKGKPRAVAYEALLDSSETEFESPQAMLDRAVSRGSDIRAELELSAISAAVEAFSQEHMAFGVTPTLFVNASVILLNSAYRSKLLSILGSAEHQVTLEITEDAFKITDRELTRAVGEVRSIGVKIAIDDFGRGNSNIDRVFLVRPDYIKIDRLFSMTDERADGVLRFCRDALKNQANLILEGVECESQLLRARQFGIGLAQGYLFSR